MAGKTLLAKTLARFADVPFVIADATAITQVGKAGSSILKISSMCAYSSVSWLSWQKKLIVYAIFFFLMPKQLPFQAGYSGEDVESIICNLLAVCNSLSLSFWPFMYSFGLSSVPNILVEYCFTLFS